MKQIQTLLVTDSKFEKTKANLGIFVDEEGIYRCGGRLHKASLSFECKHPAIIPKDHHITELIIKDSHNKVYHNGVKETLNQVRSQYWTTKGRQAVKKIIGTCITCKRLEDFAYQSPPTAPLPDFRVNEERPFKYTGTDYCGPVYIKTASHTEKNYIALMTCAATRMIYLELVRHLSATSLVQCLKRFVGRRGLPKLMLSNNGKTFKGDQLKAFNMTNGIIWRFNLAKAPWWGGLFE